MIEFKGEFSDECRQYLLEQQHKGMILLSIIIGVLFITPLLLLSFFWEYALIGSIAGMALVVFEIFYLSSQNTKLHKESFVESLPNGIIIENDTIETFGIGELSYKCKNIQDIKEVLDMGKFYAIVFHFPNMDRRFICQKDLLVEGTIEEFEKLFEDKIVRKYETKD